MKTSVLALGFVVLSSVGRAQTFTVSATTLPGGTTFSGSGSNNVTLSNAQNGTTASGVTGLGTATVIASSSGFNRYNVALSSSFSVATPGSADILLTGAGSATHSWINPSGPVNNSAIFGVQAGAVFNLSNKVVSRFGAATASANLGIAQAPLVTSTSLTASTPTNVTPDVDLGANSWTFDFPGGPSGNAVINLGSVASTFSRSLSLGFASQHRDNVQIRVSVFLNATQIGSSVNTAFNTALGVNAGSAPQSIASTALGNFNIPVALIYDNPQILTVKTELWGRAFFGDTTVLPGDYLITSSTSSPITVNAVPEPASIAALSVGLVAFVRRRRK